MGITGLARWINAPTTGLDHIAQNIQRNHQGKLGGKWHLSVKSFRSNLGSIPGFQVHSERSITCLTMNDNVFVLIDDPAAPLRADILAHQPPEGQPPIPTSGPGSPAHYRTTFLTVNPPGGLEQLLLQLQARWVSVRQTGTSGMSQISQTAGQQLSVEGAVYTIGTDFIVRAGNVVLAGGAVKGMLLEAEYLPLPVMQSSATNDGTLELLNNILVSIIPTIADAKTAAVTISDPMWEEVLWNKEQEEDEAESPPVDEEAVDDIFVCGNEGIVTKRQGDWTGVDRDRRSAFLIMGALRAEGLL